MGNIPKVFFNFSMNIHNISYLPFVVGFYYVKWDIEHRPFGKIRGSTPKVSINNHSVEWNHDFSFVTKVSVDKQGTLKPLIMNFIIKRELIGKYKGDNIGEVSINLSQYVSCQNETKVFLLSKSKINSTLQIIFDVEQIPCDIIYKIPSLDLNSSKINHPINEQKNNTDEYLITYGEIKESHGKDHADGIQCLLSNFYDSKFRDGGDDEKKETLSIRSSEESLIFSESSDEEETNSMVNDRRFLTLGLDTFLKNKNYIASLFSDSL